MNLYVVVEGKRTEPILYRRWIPLLFPEYLEIPRVEDASDEGRGDTFYVIAGHGYPSHKNRIRDAIRDCASIEKPFHLIVCVDSESVPANERIRETQEIIDEILLAENVSDLPNTVIVADCCIETWLLGNAKIIKRHPQGGRLREYLEHYNIVVLDPEAMPTRSGDRNRADTHLKYVKEAFRERGLSYSKNHPGDAAEAHYLAAMVARAHTVQPDEADIFVPSHGCSCWLMS